MIGVSSGVVAVSFDATGVSSTGVTVMSNVLLLPVLVV